jgi:hypothetical protein
MRIAREFSNVPFGRTVFAGPKGHNKSAQRIALVVIRSAWIAARLLLVYYFGQQGALFFYQVF